MISNVYKAVQAYSQFVKDLTKDGYEITIEETVVNDRQLVVIKLTVDNDKHYEILSRPFTKVIDDVLFNVSGDDGVITTSFIDVRLRKIWSC